MAKKSSVWPLRNQPVSLQLANIRPEGCLSHKLFEIFELFKLFEIICLSYKLLQITLLEMERYHMLLD